LITPEQAAGAVAGVKTAADRCNKVLGALDPSVAGSALSFVLAGYLQSMPEHLRAGMWSLWKQHVALILGAPVEDVEDKERDEQVFRGCIALMTTLPNDGAVADVLANLLAALLVALPAESLEDTWRRMRHGVDQAMAAQRESLH
jgi:hypothetical protein